MVALNLLKKVKKFLNYLDATSITRATRCFPFTVCYELNSCEESARVNCFYKIISFIMLRIYKQFHQEFSQQLSKQVGVRIGVGLEINSEHDMFIKCYK